MSKRNAKSNQRAIWNHLDPIQFSRRRELDDREATWFLALKPKTVRWLLVFLADGRFVGVQDLRGDDPRSRGLHNVINSSDAATRNRAGGTPSKEGRHPANRRRRPAQQPKS